MVRRNGRDSPTGIFSIDEGVRVNLSAPLPERASRMRPVCTAPVLVMLTVLGSAVYPESSSTAVKRSSPPALSEKP